MSRPLVSVVVTTFDMAHSLPETLESVFAQSYPDVEIIVVDDGSVDDTPALLTGYGSAITPVVRRHEGLGATRNAGLQRATGEYLLFLDADDLLEPDAIAIQVDMARRHPESGLVIGDGTVIGRPAETGNRLYPERIAALLREAGGTHSGDLYGLIVGECPARCPAQTLVPMAVASAVGPVCITPDGAQDYDYYLRIARVRPVTAHTERVVRYRVHETSMSGPYAGRTLRFAAQAIELLEREHAACDPAQQPVLAAEMRRRARVGLQAAAVELADTGTRPDPARVRVLRRHLPPRGRAAALALTTVPPPMGRAALEAARRLRPRRQRSAAVKDSTTRA